MDGSVEGSTPAWTLDGPGRSKEAKGPVSELAATGLSGFYSQSKDPGAFSTTRRHFDAQYQANSQPSAEPSLCVGGTGGYYERRKGYNDSGHYRPHIKQFQPAIHLDKPDRRKLVADPTTKQELVQGIKTVKINDDPGHMNLPAMPRLIHGRGMHATFQDQRELLLEKEIGRKIRSYSEAFYGQGRAGDMSVVYSGGGRVEDFHEYYKTPKDAPTFTRFVASCAPSPLVPHSERRRLWYDAKEVSEKQSEVDIVKDLDNWDPEAPPKRMDIPDPDEEDPAEGQATAAKTLTKKKSTAAKGKKK